MASTPTPDQASARLEAAVAYCRAAAHKVRGVDPQLPSDDLAPLLGLLDGTQVIGLGESTHGTSEFFRLKHRIVQALAEHHGTLTLALEASAAECEVIDACVTSGRGDLGSALAEQRFWTWDTFEVLALLSWMRDFNDRHGPRLRVVGVDLQFPTVAVHQTLAWLTDRGDDVDALREALEPLTDDASVDAFGSLPWEVKEAALTAARRLVEAVDARRDDPAWCRAALVARTVEQGARLRSDLTAAWHVRDRAMADNLMHVLEHEPPAGPLVFWAHNGHLGRASLYDATSAGGHLGARLGKRYAVVALTTADGAMRVIDGRTGELDAVDLPPAPEDSVDAVFGSVTGEHTWWLTLRGQPLPPWFTATQERMVGGLLDPDPAKAMRAVNLATAYDAIVHVPVSTATDARPSGARPRRGESVDRDSWQLSWTGPAAAYSLSDDGPDGVVLQRQPDSGTWGWARLACIVDAAAALELAVSTDAERSAAWIVVGQQPRARLRPGQQTVRVTADAWPIEVTVQLAGPGSVRVRLTSVAR